MIELLDGAIPEMLRRVSFWPEEESTVLGMFLVSVRDGAHATFITDDVEFWRRTAFSNDGEIDGDEVVEKSPLVVRGWPDDWDSDVPAMLDDMTERVLGGQTLSDAVAAAFPWTD